VPCQVLPDWAKDAPRGSASRTPLPPSTLKAEALLLHCFMEDAGKARAAQKLLTDIGPGGARVANKFYIQAYEHGLRGGLGLSFTQFRPAKPVGPLEAWEKRHFTPHATSGSKVVFPATDPPGRLRSVIEDTRSGDMRFELPFAMKGGKILAKPSLHTVLDKGSVGFPAVCWLYWAQKLRGCIFADFWHQDWNGLQSAALEAGVWHVCLERCLLMNMPHGPWAGDTFFNVLKAAASRYMAANGPTNELFCFMFDRIC
jgi:hypothetical protein